MVRLTPLKNYTLPLAFFYFTSFLSLDATAQNKVDSAMNFPGNNASERIYIAFSKHQYVSDETIRFKAFVFSGYHLSQISTNLYVELINRNKSIIDEKIFPIIGGITEGSIHIPDSLPEDVYYIRAFTQNIINSAQGHQYINPIAIYNEKSPTKLKRQNSFWSAAFVEGGSLLANKQATVAVRLYSSGKLPASWKGYLINSDDTTKSILTYVSLDPNIATFSFIPLAGKQYTCVIEDENGNKLKADLPMVLSKGVNMQANLLHDTLEYMLDFNNIPLNENYKLVGTVNNDIVYKASFKNQDSFIVHSFSTADMPRGVLRLTLFDNSYHALSERLVFLYPTSSQPPKLDFTSLNKTPGGVNQLKIKIDSGNVYCLVVADGIMENVYNNDNLVSAFWLTSIFSDIQNGRSYFLNSTRNKNILDAVLISEINILPKWEDLFNPEKAKPNEQKENYLTYAAKVYYRNKPMVNEPLTLMLFMSDSTRQIFQVQTDSMGEFVMEGLLFEGAAKLSYQSGKKKRIQQDIKIEIVPSQIKDVQNFSLPPCGYILVPADENYVLPAEVKRSIENLKNERLSLEKFKTLNAVFVKSKQKSATEKLYRELTGNGFPPSGEMIYDFINIQQAATGGTSIYQWLNNRESFTKYTRFFVDAMQADLEWVNSIYTADVALAKVAREGGTKTVRIFLNHGKYNNISRPATDIEQIPTMQGFSNRDTIGLTYLNKRTTPYTDKFPAYYNYNAGINSLSLKGYDKEEPLYYPDYIKESPGDKDTRDLLYWSSLLETDKNENEQRVFFNNNSTAKNFRIIVFGFKDEETPVFSEQTEDK